MKTLTNLFYYFQNLMKTPYLFVAKWLMFFGTVVLLANLISAPFTVNFPSWYFYSKLFGQMTPEYEYMLNNSFAIIMIVLGYLLEKFLGKVKYYV